MYSNELLNSYVLIIAVAAGLAVIIGLLRYFLDLGDSLRSPFRRRREHQNPWDGPPRGYRE